MHDASRNRSYSGTFVVSAATGAMASSRIWHVCDGQTQMERVDALTGTPRTVFRYNGVIRTFFPESRVVRDERHDALAGFPQLPQVEGAVLEQHYAAESLGKERVAGLWADVVSFRPRDTLRFGYRLWIERDTGLLIKLQTVGASQQVLEQAAFSALDLEAPVAMDRLQQMMNDTQGYRVMERPVVQTTSRQEGWLLRHPVAGFVAVHCYKEAVSAGHRAGQCVYSDGLATVSLFVEPYEAAHHPVQVQSVAVGATHSYATRVAGDAWVTAVGEVPLKTLQQFTEQLGREP